MQQKTTPKSPTAPDRYVHKTRDHFLHWWRAQVAARLPVADAPNAQDLILKEE